MKFKSKVDFIIGETEKFDDPLKPPTASEIHEKVISKSKKTLESCGNHPPLILIHHFAGLTPIIFEFPPDDSVDKLEYCNELTQLLITFGASGYSIMLFGSYVSVSQKEQKNFFSDIRPDLHSNKQEIFQILTENDCDFKCTTSFDIIRRTIKGKNKTKLIQRQDFKEYGGLLSGLIVKQSIH